LLSRDVRDTGSMGPRELKMVIFIYLATILGLGAIGVASKSNLITVRLAKSSVELETAPEVKTAPASLDTPVR